MTCSRVIVSLFVLFMVLGTMTAGQQLDSRFKLPLGDKDRVLGTLEGNFAVYGRPYIAMYDNRGNKLWSRKIKNNIKPYLSPNGRYLALATYADRSPTDLMTYKLELFRSDGSRLWQISKPSATGFFISNSGLIIGIEGVPGIPPTRLHLYDASGNRIKALNFDDYRGLVFSPGGDKFIVDRGNAGLEVYDDKGEVEALLPPADQYVFSPGGEYIGTFIGGYFTLFNKGQRVSQFQFIDSEIVGLALSIEADIVILAGQRNIGLFEPLTGRAIKEFRLNEPEKSVTSVDLAEDGNSFVCGVDISNGHDVPKNQRHTEGYIYLYQDRGGNLVLHKEKYKSWRVGLPVAVFSDLDNSLMIMTAEAVKKLAIPEQ